MSIKEVSNNIDNSEPKSWTGTESRISQATSLLGWGLKASYQSVGSLANIAVSYVPSRSQKTFLQTLESLSSEDYKKLLEFISTGDPDLCCPAFKSLLLDIANHWQEVQTLIKIETPSQRLLDLVGTAQLSPLILFQLIHQFSQPHLWKYLQKDLIAWPIDNCDEALVRHGFNKGLTAQFDKDFPRTHYVVQDKDGTQTDFPTNYQGDKIKDFEKALQKLSVFKDISTIPFPIQEALTQTTAIATIVIPLWNSLNAGTPPPNFSQRTFILEEGDDSYFYLKIQEKLEIPEMISFDYSYNFKISKINEKEWSSTLLSLSFVEPTVGKNPGHLFNICQPSDSQTLSMMFDTLMLHVIYNLQAAAICEDEEVLNRLEKQIQKLWDTLRLQFTPEIWEKSVLIKEFIQTCDLAESAKKIKGMNILLYSKAALEFYFLNNGIHQL